MKLFGNLLLVAATAVFGQLGYSQEDDVNSVDYKAYNDFDFIAGEKTLYFEDFTGGLNKWKVIEFDASEEVMPPGINNKPDQTHQWFKAPRRGIFYPTNLAALPEEFTIEFDLWADAETMSEMESGLILSIIGDKVVKEEYSTAFDENPQVQIDIHPSLEFLYCIATKENSEGERVLDRKEIRDGWKQGKVHHISVARIGTHIKVYIDEKKYIDLPQGLPQKANYTLVLATNMWGDGMYFTNLRVAGNLPAPPMKIDNEHKLVTNAIYFNTNSSVIKAESWSALKRAAEAIQLSQGTITIIGHTDADGNDDANQKLSEERAASVKSFLIKNFGIDASRLLTAGKGESEPIDKNDTPEGKANNRRVEFVLQ